MLRRAYDWIMTHADRPYAVWLMAGVSFTESSFFPLPPDILLIPQILADRRLAFRLATIATCASVLGGFLGYAIGYWLFDSVGTFMVTHLWSLDGFNRARTTFAHYGFWLIVFKGATPIPFKIVTILCGFLHYNFAKFVAASIIARGMRFYLEAILLYRFGDAARSFVEKRLVLVTTGILVLLVGGFLLLHHL